LVISNIMNVEFAGDIVDTDTLFLEHGIKPTAQRKSIWASFADSSQGYTVLEAVTRLKLTGIGQATVYRTVSLLAEAGLLARVQDDSERASRYIAKSREHSHPLLCKSCRAVVEFADCDLSVLEKLLHAQTGYLIQGHHVEIYGLCPDCQLGKTG